MKTLHRLRSAASVSVVLLIALNVAEAAPIKLLVTYSNPTVVSGGSGFGLATDLSRGLPILPATVTSTFLIDETAFARPPDDGEYAFDLGDIEGATLVFGDGVWTQLQRFELQLGHASEADAFEFLGLSYGFHPISTPSIASGITNNNNFQLTITGTNIETGDGVKYFYAGSTQRFASVPDTCSTIALFGWAFVGLAVLRWCFTRWLAPQRTGRTMILQVSDTKVAKTAEYSEPFAAFASFV